MYSTTSALFALSLFALRTTANPQDGVTEIIINTSTAASCSRINHQGQTTNFSFVASLGESCNCYESADQVPSNATVCPNGSSSCVSTQIRYSNGTITGQPATCQPCSPSDGNCLYGTDTIFQNKCKSNTVYAIQAATNDGVCACGEQATNFPNDPKKQCPTTDNGFAYCYTSQNSTTENGPITAMCGVGCNSGYNLESSSSTCVAASDSSTTSSSASSSSASSSSSSVNGVNVVATTSTPSSSSVQQTTAAAMTTVSSSTSSSRKTSGADTLHFGLLTAIFGGVLAFAG